MGYTGGSDLRSHGSRDHGLSPKLISPKSAVPQGAALKHIYRMYDSKDEKQDKRIARSLFWKAAENGGDQILTFVISLVLARLLGPEDYGTLSLMLVFISVANVIIQSGFQTSLIQKRDINDEDLSSVFWIGLLLSALIYGLLFVTAPATAVFFEDAAISSMLRVLALILFFGSVISVETAIVARELNFKAQCAATMIADTISGAVGIAFAFRGAGAWALVYQQLCKYLFLMLLLSAFVGWRPKLLFSKKRIGGLFSYGWKVLVSGLIDTLYNNVYTPVISKLYDPVTVGYYNRADQFPKIIANAVGQTMQSVMLPIFSKQQDEREGLRATLKNTIKLSCYLIFPMMTGLCAVAKPMISLLLGEAWIPSAPILSLSCLSYICWSMHVSNIQAVNASGRSDIYLKIEVIKKLIGIMVLVFSAPLGIEAMLIFKAVSDLICSFINAAPNAKLVGYGPLKQWRDVLPELILSIAMGIAVWVVGQRIEGMTSLFGSFGDKKLILSLTIQVLLGIAIYVGGSAIFRLSGFRILFGYLRRELHD